MPADGDDEDDDNNDDNDNDNDNDDDDNDNDNDNDKDYLHRCNSVNFKAGTSKFFLVIDLDNTYR